MNSTGRHIGMWIIAAGFSWATVILSAGPLRALRKSSPFWVFWPVVFLITAGFWFVSPYFAIAKFVAAGFLAVAILVGFFTEIENLGGSTGIAAFGSILALIAGIGVGFGAWAREQKLSPLTWVTTWVETGLSRLREVNPTIHIEADQVVSQLPSAIIILALVTLALAIVTEGTWLRILRQCQNAKGEKYWLNFRLGDVEIYLFMVVLLASFLNHGVKWLTILGFNALNVLVVLYFFQGMAVIYKACDRYGVSYFWKTFLGFILVLQLALIVAVVGVADYWIDFRRRFNRPPMKTKTQV